MAFSSTLIFSPHLPHSKLPLPPCLSRKFRFLSSPLHCASSGAFTTLASSSSLLSPMSSFDLRSYWTSMISLIQSELDAAIPIAHPERIYKAMRYSVLSDGAKRASPIMCIAACELVGGDRSAAFPTACALEMVHAASLIHDDLPCMDGAPLRRGRPSNHAVFGVEIALLAGDALFPLAFRHIVGRTPSLVPPATVLRVIAEIARTVGSTGMAAGQMLDLLPDAGIQAREPADVMLVLEKKFGELAETSALCGGLLGGANAEETAALRRYGRAVGVLYEVVDDILMEQRGAGSNGHSGKMKSNASVVGALGMDRAMEIVDELKEKAKKELKYLGDKFGDGVLPLCGFVDYAVERGFVVEAVGRT
ncbi:Heterodimeric geranylgeranyl pyrophosphate synthase small subunit, chloroplastic [Apostasia shenzhenica]|uniref:Heterodimeric geranylgeranyl pyrophosphate synthase small subunit, chloroplastic n=1 Tax=Apostasia shenzhenica TaxID=1088818 RepID=A0A2I0AEP5_9ASPA|nr:Heterodimeric geranylgeranyl pyrophosphate synthase small subunit, chloroplastic [Apostasia shenzhenica]